MICTDILKKSLKQVGFPPTESEINQIEQSACLAIPIKDGPVKVLISGYKGGYHWCNIGNKAKSAVQLRKHHKNIYKAMKYIDKYYTFHITDIKEAIKRLIKTKRTDRKRKYNEKISFVID